MYKELSKQFNIT